MTNGPKDRESLAFALRALKLPAFVAHHQEIAERAEKGGWSFTPYLSHPAELELGERSNRRIERLLKDSGLPPDKTVGTLNPSRLPAPVRRQLPTLCEGDFVRRGENLLAFGLPGRGKTHLVAAIGHELVKRGFPVLFLPAFSFTQRLPAGKRNLALERELRRLDRFALVILDDIGYIQQDAGEMEVLFTFPAQRYERRSVAITSNLVFSQWDKIFKDPMTTMAAIDRLVHHPRILELTGPSFRTEEAMERNVSAKARGGAKEGGTNGGEA